MINIKKIEVNIGNSEHITNTYLIYNDKNEGILIDPGYDSEKIKKEAEVLNVQIKVIVITHAHGDHIGALEEIQKHFSAMVIVHKYDLERLVGDLENYSYMFNIKKQNVDMKYIIPVDDGYIFEIQDAKFEIIHTPGHSKGSICVFESNNNFLFTGDTIFCDCYGRCDLESGNYDDFVLSVKKIFSRFSDINIYPGHDNEINIESAKKKIRLLMAMKGTKI